MLEGLTAPPKKGAPMVVQCGEGDITEQFRRVRTSEDMVNTRAAKLTAAGERPRVAKILIGGVSPFEG
jgi:hypothetical protein